MKEMTIMLDCGLSAQSILNFLPLPLVPSPRLGSLSNWLPRDCNDPQLEGELKECHGRVFVDSAPEFCPPLGKLIDYSEIDVILISNYTAMLALPYITEGTGFHGIVYATEPTLQIGKFYLEELVQYLEQTPKAALASRWKELLHLLPPPLSESFKPRCWKQLYNLTTLSSSLARIQTVGYNEKLDVYGALKVTAVSSGYCLGSSNWVINLDHEKVAYVSGSSTLTTHPRPMDQNALKNADLLILSGLTQVPSSNPDSMLGELCMTVVSTLRGNGSVLIPCYPSGVIYDLFECLSAHLDSSSLSQIPMFFISPVADTSLAYSNILAEWLSEVKQNRVFMPEEPFPHAYLVKMGRLKHFTHIYANGFNTEFRMPCVVFCGHPSLRFGASVHFVELWGSNPAHTIIFTEPDFAYLDALAPFQPLAMKAVHCPIDTSLNFVQANKLVRELKPANLVLPDCYTVPPPSLPHRTDLVIQQADHKVLVMKRGEVISLPLKKKKVKVKLSAELASCLTPTQIKPGVMLSSLTGNLVVRDNHFDIKMFEGSEGDSNQLLPVKSSQNSQFEWGTVNVDLFVQRLNEEGITDAKVEPSPSGYIIHLQNQDTVIQIDDRSTHIFCEEPDQKLRKHLRKVLSECLNKF
ncbi:unnamed protein product [Bemisia tabaci]|uniref:Beta-Casp domain-containing protein n=2 Tax=Bemisia tabaci TaxID=7038 RepID=A0A9N9ZZD4_BEMTA|nr:unnamed protein product [Bemisia tabaci]